MGCPIFFIQKGYNKYRRQKKTTPFAGASSAASLKRYEALWGDEWKMDGWMRKITGYKDVLLLAQSSDCVIFNCQFNENWVLAGPKAHQLPCQDQPLGDKPLCETETLRGPPPERLG